MPGLFDLFHQFHGMGNDLFAGHDYLDAIASALMPEHGRADSSQEQGANDINIVLILQLHRVALHHYPGEHGAYRIGVYVCKLPEDVLVQHGEVYQFGGCEFDAVRYGL